MTTRPTLATMLALVLVAAPLGRSTADEPRSGPAVPVGLAWVEPDTVWVALRDARAIAEVRVSERRLVRTIDLGFRPVAVVLDDTGRLVVGGADGEVGVLETSKVVRRIREATGRGPARVAALASDQIAVACLWDRSVQILDARDGRLVRSVPVGFAPGALVRVGSEEFAVAGAFGNALIRVNRDGAPTAARHLDGFNLRALAMSPDGRDLLIGHMSQYGSSPLTGANLDWGLVLSSRLSAVRLAELESPRSPDTELPRVRVTLDGSGHGAADPAAIAVSREGTRVYVALAGSNQVAQVERSPGRAEEPAAATLGHSEGVEVVNVGRNPVALALSPDGTTLATANAMDDSLTLIDARRFEVAARIVVGPPRAERTAAQRGEAWFVDASLSQDRWMSCSTCHTQGHTASLQFDTLGDGGYGAAKNTPSLLGNHDTPPYGWTGRFARIEDQVAQSLSTSLRGRGAGPELVADLSAYLRSLPAPPPLRRADDPLAQHGARVFQERKCDRCHAGPGFTTVGVKDVGLDDGAGGHRAFNPPSLRGVGWSAPYFHDGRATDLDAVLLDHPRGSRELPADERAALRAYLESL